MLCHCSPERWSLLPLPFAELAPWITTIKRMQWSDDEPLLRDPHAWNTPSWSQLTFWETPKPHGEVTRKRPKPGFHWQKAHTCHVSKPRKMVIARSSLQMTTGPANTTPSESSTHSHPVNPENREREPTVMASGSYYVPGCWCWQQQITRPLPTEAI